MSAPTLQHTKLDGVVDYTNALDQLCKLARQELQLFERNYDGLGYNGEARYETLRHFLLANSNNKLYVLAHDVRYLTTQCARMTMLLRQFGHSMHIYQTPKHLQHITEPFAVADNYHYVRRFHFDDTRGIFAQNDPEQSRALKSRYMEMWANSHPAASATTLGL